MKNTVVNQEEIEETKQAVSSATESVKRAAKRAGSQVAAAAERSAITTGEKLKGRGLQIVRSKQTEVTSKLREIQDAGRRAADDLEGSTPQVISSGTRTVADATGYVADYLDEKEIEEMVKDAANFTRRHPVAVLGTMFTVGVSLGRFLRASEPEATPPASAGARPYGTGVGVYPTAPVAPAPPARAMAAS